MEKRDWLNLYAGLAMHALLTGKEINNKDEALVVVDTANYIAEIMVEQYSGDDYESNQ
jgi:hypothetical protein